MIGLREIFKRDVHKSRSELTRTVERSFGEISSKLRELKAKIGVFNATSSLQSCKSTCYFGGASAVSSLLYSCMR